MTSQPALTLEINSEDERTFGPCDCCGNMTRRVWGYVNEGEATICIYMVQWTPGHLEQAASFDLIIGYWGDNVGPKDRHRVALNFNQFETGPAFTVIDPALRPMVMKDHFEKSLSREEVIGKEIAKKVFDICDLIFLGDARVAPLHERTH